MYHHTLIKQVTLTKCAEIKAVCAMWHKNRLKLYLHKGPADIYGIYII